MADGRESRGMGLCSYCPRLCRHACPVACAEKNEAVTPTQKVNLARLLLEGGVGVTSDMADRPYHCLDCLLCRSHCDHQVEVPVLLERARAAAVRAGVEPEPARELARRFDRTGLPQDGIQPVRGLDPVCFVAEAQVAYFPGCRTLHDDPGLVPEMLAVFARLGIDYIALPPGDPFCCGLPLHAAGYRERFAAVAERTAERLNRYRRVVTDCPACAYAFLALYPEAGVRVAFGVEHISALFDRHRAAIERETAGAPPFPAIYHDPCYLGRYLGSYDPPRAAATAICGAEPAEAATCRSRAFCCGGGGGVAAALPEVAGRVAGLRAAELARGGMPAVVAWCPGCVEALGAAGRPLQLRAVSPVRVLHERLFGRTPAGRTGRKRRITPG